MESFRKAYGALKDSTKVGLAKVNSEFKDLDIAIVKATNHAQCPPKERHVRKIYAAVAITRPRADVGYCIHALSKRLSKTRSWIVAIKTLIVFHRILREGDPSFREQLLHIHRRGRIFEVAHFKDDSGPLAWDCSAWIRTYGFYLEERLECFRNLNYDIEADRSSKPGISKELRKTTSVLNTGNLLDRLPSLQQLLFRLVCCQPEGAARHNFLIQYAMALVVKESFKVYCAINDGIINLVDMFFEMPRHEAVRALEIYKRAGRQADHLADFYEFCRTLELARTFQFPTLRQPPPSFLSTMEDYIKEAPLSPTKQECQEKKEDPGKPEEEDSPENEKQSEGDENKDEKIVHQDEETETESNAKEVDPPLISTDESVDLLGLDEVSQKTGEFDESNAFALAIVQPGNNALQSQNASGWEVALVTAPSNINKPLSSEAKLAGGFNRSLLDSLYEDDMARRQIQLHSAGYSTNSYEYEMATQQNMFDPFAVNHQHHQMMMMQEQQQNMMMMVPYGTQYNHHHHQQYYQNQHQYPQTQYMGSSNPFGDPFGGYGQGGMQPAQGNHSLL